MRRVVLLLLVCGCGDPDFEVPARTDMRTERDLSSSFVSMPPDMSCLNMACGGCSSWLSWDGTAVEAGDPCLYRGTWMCAGTQLVCSDASCPTCAAGTMVGSVCGADGHTILELTQSGGMCRVYDFGSA